jgi:hypothetical protein
MKNIFIVLLLLISFNSYSQKEKGYMAFTNGASIPFAETSSNESFYSQVVFKGSSVGVNTGFSVSGSFGYEFNRIGISVQIHRAGLQSRFHSDKLRNWKLESALAGPFVNVVRSENKYYMDIRFLAGYAKMQTPVYGKNKFYVTQIEEGDGFAFQTGIICRVPFSKKLSLIFSADYYSASIKWKAGTDTFEGPVSAFNIQFGVAGRLWK